MADVPVLFVNLTESERIGRIQGIYISELIAGADIDRWFDPRFWFRGERGFQVRSACMEQAGG